MRLSNFLNAETRGVLLDWALSNEARFVPSRTGGGGRGEGGVNPDKRVSSLLEDLGPCKAVLKAAITPRFPEFAEALGVNHRSFKRFEAELAAHNDGAFFKTHLDTGRPDSPNYTRTLSAVYYFHNHPKGFSGGELRLFDLSKPGAYVDYEPEDNSLVVFPAFVPHEVRLVTCPSKRFADSRFAINVWAHRAPDD